MRMAIIYALIIVTVACIFKPTTRTIGARRVNRHEQIEKIMREATE